MQATPVPSVQDIESRRLHMLEQRDGVDGAIVFAARTYDGYREALRHSRRRGFKDPSHASLPEYRLSFVRSCLAFRAYLRARRGFVKRDGR